MNFIPGLLLTSIIRSRNNLNSLLTTEEFDINILERIVCLLESEKIPKCENFYEVVIPSYQFSTFKSHFRMTSGAFEFILNQIAHDDFFRKRSEEYGGRTQQNPEKALLIAIWTLATPESYRSIGDRFNVTKSTVFYCLHGIVKVILNNLCKMYIRWPRLEEQPSIADGFNKYGFTSVVGVIDGCHIPIKRPNLHPMDYFNRKKFYSVVLQGVCKYNLTFTDVDVRWPGGVHDARVLRTSDMFQLGPRLCQPNYFLLGDAAYPLLWWLMTPFKNNGHLTPSQRHYNKALSKTRVRIEHSFGLLKGRFRRLKDLLDMNDEQNIMNTIVASCVLHNICIVLGDDTDIEAYIHEGLEDIALLNIENAPNNDPRAAILRDNLVQEMWEARPIRILSPF